jgi:hypothetical protein
MLDTNHDDMAKLIDWRDPVLWAMAANVDFSTLAAFSPAHGLTPSEWDAYQADIASPKHNAQAAKEQAQYTDSFTTIAEKGQLHRPNGEKPLMGDSPVCIHRVGTIEYLDFVRPSNYPTLTCA